MKMKLIAIKKSSGNNGQSFALYFEQFDGMVEIWIDQ